MGADQLGAALKGCEVVVIPAGVPRKPGGYIYIFCFFKCIYSQHRMAFATFYLCECKIGYSTIFFDWLKHKGFGIELGSVINEKFLWISIHF